MTAPTASPGHSIAAGELAAALHFAAAALAPMAPMAGLPPRLNSDAWRSSCRGAEHRRCGDCEVCVWEREADRWNFAAPWSRQQVEAHREGRPRWSSLDQALGALADWHEHGRADASLHSAMGPLIDRLARGDVTPSWHGSAAHEPRGVANAADVWDLEGALRRAVKEPHALNQAAALAALFARIPRTGVERPSFAALAEGLGASEADLRASVRRLRSLLSFELVERGLLMTSRRSARAVVWASASVRCEADEVGAISC